MRRHLAFFACLLAISNGFFLTPAINTINSWRKKPILVPRPASTKKQNILQKHAAAFALATLVWRSPATAHATNTKTPDTKQRTTATNKKDSVDYKDNNMVPLTAAAVVAVASGAGILVGRRVVEDENDEQHQLEEILRNPTKTKALQWKRAQTIVEATLTKIKLAKNKIQAKTKNDEFVSSNNDKKKVELEQTKESDFISSNLDSQEPVPDVEPEQVVQPMENETDQSTTIAKLNVEKMLTRIHDAQKKAGTLDDDHDQDSKEEHVNPLAVHEPNTFTGEGVLSYLDQLSHHEDDSEQARPKNGLPRGYLDTLATSTASNAGAIMEESIIPEEATVEAQSIATMVMDDPIDNDDDEVIKPDIFAPMFDKELGAEDMEQDYVTEMVVEQAVVDDVREIVVNDPMVKSVEPEIGLAAPPSAVDDNIVETEVSPTDVEETTVETDISVTDVEETRVETEVAATVVDDNIVETDASATDVEEADGKESIVDSIQPKYIRLIIADSPEDIALKAKYASIESLEERMYTVLVDLGMAGQDEYDDNEDDNDMELEEL